MDNQNSSMGKGRLEQLENRILQLLRHSRDPYYTEYLQKMLARVNGQKEQADLLLDELDRSYQMYLRRNPFASSNRQEDFRGAQPDSSRYTPPYADAIAVQRPKTQTVRRNTEFTVGVAVFSVIGVVFILASFVMLGMNFMNGFAKGMSLYAIALVLLLISELVLYKKNPRIGRAVSAIGIGMLYLSTILNYLQLGNFNGMTAMVAAAVITAGTLLLGRKRESGLMHVMGMTACYLCFLPIAEGITGAQFIVITGIVFLINLMSALILVKQSETSIGIVQMISNTLFTQFFVWRAVWCGVEAGYLAGFLLSSYIILNLIFLILLRKGDRKAKEGRHFDKTGVITAFCISGCVFAEMSAFIVLGGNSPAGWMKHVVVGTAAVVSAIFFLLAGKRKERWLLYYFVQILAAVLYVFPGNEMEAVICILSLLIVSKLLTGIKELAVSEAVVTVTACLMALVYHDAPYVYIIGAGVVVSVFFIHRWQTFYEIAITLTCAVLAMMKLPGLISLPAAVGIVFVGILLVHNVKRWKGRAVRIYNYTALAMQTMCFLLLFQRIYSRAYITYLMMLVFGLATVVLTFHEKYEMDFRYKNLILSVFLTYMAFVCRTGIPVFTSILLMVIALVSVGAGFAGQDKSVRIYGLALSLFVCAKVTLYDFTGAAAIQRMILFFVVGAIALIISGIYIVLEKKQR